MMTILVPRPLVSFGQRLKRGERVSTSCMGTHYVPGIPGTYDDLLPRAFSVVKMAGFYQRPL